MHPWMTSTGTLPASAPNSTRPPAAPKTSRRSSPPTTRPSSPAALTNPALSTSPSPSKTPPSTRIQAATSERSSLSPARRARPGVARRPPPRRRGPGCARRARPRRTRSPLAIQGHWRGQDRDLVARPTPRRRRDGDPRRDPGHHVPRDPVAPRVRDGARPTIGLSRALLADLQTPSDDPLTMDDLGVFALFS